jgi:hypothetical protein
VDARRVRKCRLSTTVRRPPGRAPQPQRAVAPRIVRPKECHGVKTCPAISPTLAPEVRTDLFRSGLVDLGGAGQGENRSAK